MSPYDVMYSMFLTGSSKEEVFDYFYRKMYDIINCNVSIIDSTTSYNRDLYKKNLLRLSSLMADFEKIYKMWI